MFTCLLSLQRAAGAASGIHPSASRERCSTKPMLLRCWSLRLGERQAGRVFVSTRRSTERLGKAPGDGEGRLLSSESRWGGGLKLVSSAAFIATTWWCLFGTKGFSFPAYVGE